MKFIPHYSFLSLTFLLLLFFIGCTKAPRINISKYNNCEILETECIRDKIKVEMITNRGKVLLELNGHDAPLTSTNFMLLMDRELYSGTFFDRSIRKPFPFIIQGGNRDLNYNVNSSSESYFDNKDSLIQPIPLEIKLYGEEFPRYNQLITRSDDINRIILTHEKGSIGMARMQSLDSARLKFYITLKDSPELDGRYTVFGKVVKGMDIIESINEGDVILKLRIIK